jgi:hypothetical protein
LTQGQCVNAGIDLYRPPAAEQGDVILRELL